MNKKRFILITSSLLALILLLFLYKKDYFSAESSHLRHEYGQFICPNGEQVDVAEECKKPPKYFKDTHREVKIKVNGQWKLVSEKTVGILTRTNRPTVKVAISSTDNADIKVEYNEVIYKVFKGQRSGIIYFNDGKIHQFEITQEEMEQINTAVK